MITGGGMRPDHEADGDGPGPEVHDQEHDGKRESATVTRQERESATVRR
jgi:hypothetical protein